MVFMGGLVAAAHGWLGWARITTFRPGIKKPGSVLDPGSPVVTAGMVSPFVPEIATYSGRSSDSRLILFPRLPI